MSVRTRRRAGRITLAVVKDVTLFAIGSALIVRQGFVVPLQEFNPYAMGFGAILAGVPGVLQLWALRGVASSSPTDGSFSPSAAEQSPPQ